jgi:hypothetical protein
MYLSKIIKGHIQNLQKEKHSKFEWCDYNSLNEYKNKGILVPNLCSSLKDLKNLSIL